jgi:type IV pilus assembly protein PilC
MKYRYTGVTRQRERVAGVIESVDEAEARLRLRSMQIRAETITAAPENGGASFDLAATLKKLGQLGGGRVKLKQLILFTKQFSSLIDSGVPVVQCLDILYLQEKRGVLKETLATMKSDIEAGNGLATALSKHPKIFSEFFIRIVEAGELSGTLDKAIKQVGLQLEKLDRLKAKVIKALSYPAITLVVAFGVLVFLLVKVVPEIAKLYSEGKAELPELTVFVLALSKWVQTNFLVVTAVVAAVVATSSVLYKMPKFRAVFDPFLLRVPLIGSLILRSAVAQLTRTLGTLVSSGVPLINAFEICAKLMTNLAIRDAIKITMQFVQEGRTIAAGLQAKNIFPPMVIHMVNIGEMTGRLDELLSKVASIYDDEVDDAISGITGMLQPAIIVFVGIIIAFLLIAMYLPVFQLADKVSGN